MHENAKLSCPDKPTRSDVETLIIKLKNTKTVWLIKAPRVASQQYIMRLKYIKNIMITDNRTVTMIKECYMNDYFDRAKTRENIINILTHFESDKTTKKGIYIFGTPGCGNPCSSRKYSLFWNTTR